MTKAEEIMKKEAFIKAEMDRTFSAEKSNALWRQSTGKLDEILEHYADIPKGVRMHTDRYIFPSAAIYLTVKEESSEAAAYKVIEDAAIRKTSAVGKSLAKLMRLPGMKGLFIKVWPPITRKMFGAESGFQNVFYPKKKGEYRMDIVGCPYFRYFTELGCPELTKIFCENDERTYGNLPGLEFHRTGTLGTGASRCDFYIRKMD